MESLIPVTPEPTQKLAQSLPRLAIPLGDPAGIGPEVVLKAVSSLSLEAGAHITLVGDAGIVAQTLIRMGADEPLRDVIAAVPVCSVPGLDGLHATVLGQPTATTGRASFAWLRAAIAGAMAGEYDAIVTAPIAKSVWHAAGHPYPGQTEVLAEGAGVSRFGMLFAARSPHTNWRLITLLATTHIPLRQVFTSLSADLMTRKLDLLVDCLQQDFGLSAPHIAIPGLNPHSGEAGKLGTEEQDWLIPWLEQAQHRHPQVKLTGPVPPDTLWVSAGQAWYRDAGACPYDAYLALYHDQGLIPVKLLAFDRAVNTTVGLPFVRTSPDHGTAFDIAGKGIARADSMVAAIELAIDLVNQRRKESMA